jgi:hypothetical protein
MTQNHASSASPAASGASASNPQTSDSTRARITSPSPSVTVARPGKSIVWSGLRSSLSRTLSRRMITAARQNGR